MMILFYNRKLNMSYRLLVTLIFHAISNKILNYEMWSKKIYCFHRRRKYFLYFCLCYMDVLRNVLQTSTLNLNKSLYTIFHFNSVYTCQFWNCCLKLKPTVIWTTVLILYLHFLLFDMSFNALNALTCI